MFRTWKSETPKRLIWIMLAAAVAALFQFFLTDQPVKPAVPKYPNVRWIELKEAKNLPALFWIDARSQEKYEKGHPEGAIRLDLEDWDNLLPVFLNAWAPGNPILVYCSPGNCASSLEVAERLAEALPTEAIYILKGGWPQQGRESP